MPPVRQKPDPLLAAPKPKKDPFKVSSSTSVDLFAEVSLAKQKFDNDRQNTTTAALARGSRPAKKTVWGGQNKGLNLRNARDLQMEQINSVTTDDLAKSRRALEQKTLEYERLRRGWSKDLTEAQKEEIMVDFDAKYAEFDSEDEEGEYGPLEEVEVEVTDEYGRTRKIKEKRMRRPPTPEIERPANIIYGDYMPTFTPDPDKVWEINNREDKVEEVHFNPNAEVRNLGVGHYAFSADSGTRAEQMAALHTAREETEQQREAAKKAAEARRMKIEERRKEIAGKKRKRQAETFLSGLELEFGEQLKGSK